MSNRPDRTESLGKAAATLALVEVGAGSALHAFRIPLSGHALALNQAFFLARHVRVNPEQPGLRTAGAEISAVVALLKSLSPAGKRLTPMLAISAQGVCFSLGTLLLGPNLVGVIAGTIALAAWTAIQPFLLYYVIYGRELIEAAQYYLAKISGALDWGVEMWLWAALALAGVHAVLAVMVAVSAWMLSHPRVAEYERRLLDWSRRSVPKPGGANDPRSAARGALRDLARPTFLISLVLTGIFLAGAEVSSSRMMWGLLRPLAIGWLVFFLLRWIRPEWIARRVRSETLASALKEMRN